MVGRALRPMTSSKAAAGAAADVAVRNLRGPGQVRQE
jgi:hypothetical protein